MSRYDAGEGNFTRIVLTASEMTGVNLIDSDLGEIYWEDVIVLNYKNRLIPKICKQL